MNTGSTKAEKGSTRMENTQGRPARRRNDSNGTGANGQERRYQGNPDRKNGEKSGRGFEFTSTFVGRAYR